MTCVRELWVGLVMGDMTITVEQRPLLPFSLLKPHDQHQTRPQHQQPYTTYAFRAYWGPELLHAKPWVVRRR